MASYEENKQKQKKNRDWTKSWKSDVGLTGHEEHNSLSTYGGG